MVEMYVSDSLYLNAEVLDEKHWMIHLSNGDEIPVEKDPEHYGSRWGWKIGTQIFSPGGAQGQSGWALDSMRW